MHLCARARLSEWDCDQLAYSLFFSWLSNAKYFNASTLDYRADLCVDRVFIRCISPLLEPSLSGLAPEGVDAIFQIILMTQNRAHLYPKTMTDYFFFSPPAPPPEKKGFKPRESHTSFRRKMSLLTNLRGFSIKIRNAARSLVHRCLELKNSCDFLLFHIKL